MIAKSETCVLIPAYNEAKNIERVVRAVREQGFPVVVVDDGSTDGSKHILASLGIHAILSPKNEGKGASLRKGLQWFVAQHALKAVILMDGDGQHSPEELQDFLAVLNRGADVVVGNRLWKPHGMPFVRLATNRFMSWLLSRAAGQNIPDTQCGFRAMTRRAVEGLRLETDRFETESEILLDASRRGLEVHSIPVRALYRDEVSHIRPLRDTFRFFRFLVEYRRSRKT